MNLSNPPHAEVTEQTATTINEEFDTQHDDADLLVEDVSIDGMCGVY